MARFWGYRMLCYVSAASSLVLIVVLMNNSEKVQQSEKLSHEDLVVDQRLQIGTDIPNAQQRGFKLLPKPEEDVPCNIQANTQVSLGHLEISTRGDWHWEWIMKRIQSLWPHWVNASRNLESKYGEKFVKKTMKKILIVPGVLTKTNFARPDRIRAGGPLGDLVQWADLIAALHVMGHHVHLHHNLFTASKHLLLNDFRGGPAECNNAPFHSIFVDIVGYTGLSPDVHRSYRCHFRVIDAYGTQAMFNNIQYAKQHNFKSNWGKLNLNLKQFYTFYPHTPDNSFLGFVSKVPTASGPKKPIALLYGKSPAYWRNRRGFVQEIINMNISVHATLPANSARDLPGGVVYHNVVDSETYHSLLQQSKFLLAAGSPLESSGVIEALGHGTIIIQPRFKGKELNVLKGKPTSRKMKTQVPYLEDFIGPPNVYTIDIDQPSVIRKTIKAAMDNQAEPMVPEEFTPAGFLERLYHYIEYQDFCHETSNTWPPLEALWLGQGSPGESCTEVCAKESTQERTTVCEPVYFNYINDKEYLTKYIGKQRVPVWAKADLFYPAIDTSGKGLVLQGNNALFSCEGSAKYLKRLCPCRDALKYQVSLCKECLANVLDEEN